MILNAPTLEAIVGTLTKAASVHLFSLLALLNNDSSIGAKLISKEAITLGKSSQDINGEVIILCLYFINSSGISNIPTTFK